MNIDENKIQKIWKKWSENPNRNVYTLIRRLRENGFKVIRSYRVAVEGSCVAGFYGEHSHIVIKMNSYEIILCEKSGTIVYKVMSPKIENVHINYEL
jgi:nucleoside diphosphate kinase